MFENLPNLKIVNFFDITIDCLKYKSKAKLLSKNYRLKSFSNLLNEEEFAKVYMAYNERGLYFIFDVKTSYTKSFYPEIRRGDSIEIFIDTKALKTQGYLTKFCHHFVFFPENIGGFKAKEITRFKADDMHNLCSSSDLSIESIIKPKTYMLDIFIPEFCLTGYNPSQINYLAFSYRINRFQMSAQNFCSSSDEHKIEKNPYLWTRMNLK